MQQSVALGLSQMLEAQSQKIDDVGLSNYQQGTFIGNEAGAEMPNWQVKSGEGRNK